MSQKFAVRKHSCTLRAGEPKLTAIKTRSDPLRILLENLLRREGDKLINADQIEAMARRSCCYNFADSTVFYVHPLNPPSEAEAWRLWSQWGWYCFRLRR